MLSRSVTYARAWCDTSRKSLFFWKYCRSKPFFLCYTPTHPHIGSRVVNGNAHWPNACFKGTSQAGNYSDVVQELDWSVGVILDTLERLGFTEDTLLDQTATTSCQLCSASGFRIQRVQSFCPAAGREPSRFAPASGSLSMVRVIAATMNSGANSPGQLHNPVILRLSFTTWK